MKENMIEFKKNLEVKLCDTEVLLLDEIDNDLDLIVCKDRLEDDDRLAIKICLEKMAMLEQSIKIRENIYRFGVPLR